MANTVRYEVSVSVIRLEYDEDNIVVSDEEVWDAQSRLFKSEEEALNLAREAMVVVSQAPR